MANLRTIKKDISYLTGEVISDCYLALYFQGEAAEEKLAAVISSAVILHNDLITRANHPAEKRNVRLVKKHYASIQADLLNGVDELFGQISTLCAAK